MGERPRLTHGEYTIGWVCALSIERTAAIYMLDDRHKDLPNSANDHNAYNLGRIGKHNVVIAGLPKGRADNNNAATVAAQMLSTFPKIRITLMVGVGGGIPDKARLGDVVICSPTDTNGGVIQWDKGKEEYNGFKRQGCLTGPPTAGLTALSSFEADPDTSPTMRSHLNGIDKGFLKLEALEDILFESDYNHVSDAKDCSGCDKERMIKREPRSIYPTVHYGLIASGNKKVKDSRLRDQLYKEYNKNLFCIEMEAAGLMNDFPCVVIRGICDYADSHANDKWQNYAAAVAAACAKTYLGVVPEYEIHRLQPVPASITSSIIHNSRENAASSSPPVLAPKNFGNAEVVEPEAIKSRDANYYSQLSSDFYSSSPPIAPNKSKLKHSDWTYLESGEEIRNKDHLFQQFMEMLLQQGRSSLEILAQKQSIEASLKNQPFTPQDGIECKGYADDGRGTRFNTTEFAPTQPLSNDGDSGPSPGIKRGQTFPMDEYSSTNRAVLFDAIVEGNIATIKRLLQNGLDLEMIDEFGLTPLWRAVISGQRHVIQLLIEKGASIEAKNHHGQNILGWAVAKDRIDLIELLGYN
ncbi:hypothetical protein FP744_10002250 [Trichoderma asperellum]|nr:purine and uridine phosphorylase [Trichoderma asperelloides]